MSICQNCTDPIQCAKNRHCGFAPSQTGPIGETPRTDAALSLQGHHIQDVIGRLERLIAVSRTLERELAEARTNLAAATDEIERLVAFGPTADVLAEREACAALADKEEAYWSRNNDFAAVTASRIADKIRARKEGQ